MRYLIPCFYVSLLFSCSENKTTSRRILKPDPAWIDSIKNKADTNWTKAYHNSEFSSAEYYVNRKDSIVAQIMKDSAGTIRQINIAKYDNIRLFFGEYYQNGQLKARLPLDKEGRYDGNAEFYYRDGAVKSNGFFKHGMYSGDWKNYNEQGELISTDQYDANGQLRRSTPADN